MALRMGNADRKLVKRMLAGDGDAFEAFFADHFPSLFRFALMRLALAAAALLALALGLGLEWQRRRIPAAGPSEIAAADGRPAVAGRPEAIPAAVPAPREAGKAPAAPAVENGEVLRDGTRIETGPASRAALRLASGHALRLDLDTRLRVVAEAVIALEQGAVYVDSHAAPAGASVEIRTPLGVAADVGTRFELRLGERSLRVRVREGIVNVTRGGRTHEVRTGAELILDQAGGVERRTVPVYGPDWQWSLEIAPAFDLEGRTLREFLGWVSRETGWRLRFDDPALAAGTAAVILSGSIEGLTPADALAVVLPTSGLRHRVAEGVLIVERETSVRRTRSGDERDDDRARRAPPQRRNAGRAAGRNALPRPAADGGTAGRLGTDRVRRQGPRRRGPGPGGSVAGRPRCFRRGGGEAPGARPGPVPRRLRRSPPLRDPGGGSRGALVVAGSG